MTNSERESIVKWCVDHCEMKEYGWVSRVIMNRLGGNHIYNSGKAITIIEMRMAEAGDMRGIPERLEYIFTKSTMWQYDLIKHYPDIIDDMHGALIQHLSDVIDKHKPLRDYEKKMMSDLRGYFCVEEMKEDVPPGEFCREIHAAINTWIAATVQTACAWVGEGDKPAD